MNTEELFKAARRASELLPRLTQQQRDDILRATAQAIRSQIDALLEANRADLDRMNPDNPLYDRLQLTRQRIEAIADDMESVAALPSPVGEIMAEWTRPNGMKICKQRVPFGVIGIIYEARPNVTFDVFSLCFKTANACVLKGGSDARCSNEAAIRIIHQTLEAHGVDCAAATLLPSDHESTAAMLNAVGLIDVVIPRGSSRLISFVRDNARVPVIETGAGVVHTYFDADGDLEKGSRIVCNAKTRRVSVCNALDCLLVHDSRLNDLPALCAPLADRNVILYADDASFAALDGHYPAALLKHADEHSYGTEFLDYKMAIRTVASIDEALAHIAQYTSHHSEAIITENEAAARRFTSEVDAACVYVNVSTAFTDGGQFGFGAEIGISTQKLHARGPMALPELTTYKYIITGDGQIRDK